MNDLIIRPRSTNPHPSRIDKDKHIVRACVFGLSAIIVLQPIASGLRGLSPGLGQIAIASLDGLLLLLALVRASSIRQPAALVASAIALASLLYTLSLAQYPIVGLIAGFRKSFFVLVALLLASTFPANRRAQIHLSIIISCLIVSLYGIWQHFFFSQFDANLLAAQSADKYTNLYQGEHRSFSLLSSGFHAGLAALILASYGLFTKIVPTALRLVLVAISAASVYYTYTRTCLVILLLLISLKGCQLAKVPLSLFFLIGALIYAFLLFSAPDVIPNIFYAAADDSRFTGRATSYLGALNYWSTDPLSAVFGSGVGSAGSAQAELFEGRPWIEPHNIFLKYLFELGFLLGVPFLLCLGFLAARSLRKSRLAREAPFVIAILMIVLISGMTITVVEAWPANVYMFMIVGLYLRGSTETPSSPSRPALTQEEVQI